MSLILKEKKGAYVALTLNRPDKYNSFNREMALELQEALNHANVDESVRAVCLSGAGKAFCAGQDLGEAIDGSGPGIKKIVEEHYNPIIRTIRAVEKPVVAAVNGVAAGAGANIALACDVVVAKESASFIQAFSKIGLIPDSGGTFFLPRIIGFQKASALAMLGDKVDGREAEALGMIYKCFSDSSYEEEVEKILKKLASMPTKGLALTKKLMNESYVSTLEEQLIKERDAQVAATETYDYKEGVNAFLEKRKPEFKGS